MKFSKNKQTQTPSLNKLLTENLYAMRLLNKPL